MKTKVLPILSGLALIASLPVLAAATPVQLTGAGATFPYPVYSKWFSEYQKTDGTQINYQSVGSGAGISQFIQKTVDFGASDAPMSDEQLAKAGRAVLHIPTILGAVVVTYNLTELTGKTLKLSPEVLADIFLGKIAKWNDPRLTALNAGLALPDTAILVAHRSDGSGTTSIFTDYLTKVSPAWKAGPGKGTAVNWPTGLGGKGNEGVTQLVKQTPGAIGYVELIYAASQKLPVASIRNKAGTFVEPSPNSVTAAAEGFIKTMPADMRVSITDAESKAAYPISGFTYLLVTQDQKAAGPKGKAIVQFLKWAMVDGQKLIDGWNSAKEESAANPRGYASLPKPLVKKIEAKIASILTQ